MGRHSRVSTPTTKAFAERLSDLVQAKKNTGLSHDEICRQIGASSGGLSEWMSDNKTASIDNLAKISKYFGVSTDYLLGLSNLKTPDVDIQKACELTGLSDDAIKILRDSYAAKALNVFLSEDSFRNLLLCLFSYRESVIAESLYIRIFNSSATSDILATALNSVINNKNLPNDFVDAIKTHIAFQNSEDIKLSTFDSSFSPADIYELYANRCLSWLIIAITGDARSSAEIRANDAGINLPPLY